MVSASGARGLELSPEQAPVSCRVGVLVRNFPSKYDFFFSSKSCWFSETKIFWEVHCVFLTKEEISDCHKYSCCLVHSGSYYCCTCFRSETQTHSPHSNYSPVQVRALPLRYQLCWGRACLFCWGCATRSEQLHFLCVKRGQGTLPLKAFSSAECPNCFS